MDMKICKRGEILCFNFLESTEFESESERDLVKEKKQKKKLPADMRNAIILSLSLCCLGVMQISLGCLSRSKTGNSQSFLNLDGGCNLRESKWEQSLQELPVHENKHTRYSKICTKKTHLNNT